MSPAQRRPRRARTRHASGRSAGQPAAAPAQRGAAARQRLVEIAHNGEVYRLQATRLGKLILTK